MIPLNCLPQSIYFSSRPVDFRKCFDGLCGEIQDYLGHDPLSGSLFVFYNKGRNRIKLLLWDSDGFWLLYKRLELGTFELPPISPQDKEIMLSSEQLHFILSGIELDGIRHRKRFTKG